MATISGREDAFKVAKASMKHQVDRFVSVKDYKMGDAGKFAAVDGDYDYYFACDDDLRFPKDFVETMVCAIERYDRKAVVSIGGGIITDTPVDSYYRSGRTKKYPVFRDLDEDVVVNCCLTCGVAWHRDTLDVSLSDFHYANMADIWMAVLCQQQEVPQVVVAHEGTWVEHLAIDFEQTIYHKYKRDDAFQTDVVNSIQWKTFESALLV